MGVGVGLGLGEEGRDGIGDGLGWVGEWMDAEVVEEGGWADVNWELDLELEWEWEWD